MNLPPYISRTPPPLNETEDDEDEEFGTFAVFSDLGDEVCDAFEKNSHVMRGDDNVSEDSGFCMNSVCQTQSPCDVSPLSSSYYKGNECMTIENNGNIVDNSPKERDSSKSEVLKLNDSCFDQEYENFQSDDIYLEPSDSVERSEFPEKLFKNKRSSSQNSVNKVDVNFVDSNAVHIVSNTTVNGDILIDDSFSQVVNNSCFEESLKINEADWLKSSCKEVIVTEFCLKKEHSTSTYKHLKIERESTSLVQGAVNDVQAPVFPASCSKDSTNHFSDDIDVNNKNIQLVDHLDTDNDDFSEFTSFQVVESVSEIPYNKFEFQFGQSELVPQETSKHIYETLHSVVEKNCLWNNLKFFEETPAFKYQWLTSCTQIKFLQALHIDSRNILFGPWNKLNKMNLPDSSCSFEINTCNVDAFSSTNLTRNKDMIPDAHFDWITSGLINPLQGTSNEKEITHDLQESGSEILKSRSHDVLSSLPNYNFLKLAYISFK